MKNILVLLSILVLISCINTNSQIIENVNAEIFHQLIEEGDGIIIDVRTSQEFNSEHIIDAKNIDFNAKDFTERLKMIMTDIPVYVYCRSGVRSSSAANKMEEIGFVKVYNMIGGIGSWQSEGYKTVKSE